MHEAPAEDLSRVLSVGARADEAFDRLARLVRTTIRASTALVTFAAAEQQIIPGAAGLDEPWQSTRCSPTAVSPSRVVVATGRQLVINDIREVHGHDAGPWAASLAELGIVAYAGMPMRDTSGTPVGALCALDTVRREWTPEELALLSDLAATGEAEVHLREALTASSLARANAESARDAATGSELAAVSQRREAEQARAHSELLLTLSEAMAATREVSDVAVAVGAAARRGLGALSASLTLADERTRTLTFAEATPPPSGLPRSATTTSLDDANPMADASRRRRPTYYESPQAYVADYPHLAAHLEASGLAAVAHLPLITAGTLIGCLVLGWTEPHPLGERERALMSALAGYTAQALQRCMLMEAERSVVATLQRAMFSELPTPPDVSLAARYVPAAPGSEVGGDWYDAFRAADGALTLVIGDVTGHDIGAAALMGQLRAGLRTLVVALGAGPADSLAALDCSLVDLAVPATATAVLGRLTAGVPPEAGHRQLTWSNAGHPPPVLLLPDGSVEVLESEPDLLLGHFPDLPRSERTHILPVGSTLLLYTDGLVERRSSDLDAGTSRLTRALQGHAGMPLDDLLDHVVGQMLGEGAEDDLAVLAVRVLPEAPLG